MRRPPRPKSAPVLSQPLLYRILFSASMIVFGTLFIYAVELSDGTAAQRDQTMVGGAQTDGGTLLIEAT